MASIFLDTLCFESFEPEDFCIYKLNAFIMVIT